MTLIWSRVDQKLIHGQISAAWVPFLRADALLVADNDVAGDVQAQRIMMLGLASEIKVTAFTRPALLFSMLADKKFLKRRVLVLFKDLEGFLEALGDEDQYKDKDEDKDKGKDKKELPLKLLNLGNQVCRGPGLDTLLGESFYACSDELEKLAEFHYKKGLEIVVQTLPASKAASWPPQG